MHVQKRLREVWTLIEAIIEVLANVLVSGAETKTRAMPLVLLKRVKTFDYIVSLKFKNVILKTKPLSKGLQMEHLSIIDAVEMIKATIT